MEGGHSLLQFEQKDFSSPEEEATVLVFGCLSHAGRKYPHLISLVKLKSWDERHIARNDQSLTWQALRKVETEKRILFQTNIKEFYSTLSIVYPKFGEDLEQK
ncbi:hypothetical protein RDI58_020142 [Solanum bulbocastanum]|uniref:Uncharacterized protein n=1 Tax=Solanum bulbocastanum TaxID=147425 RepID=A0AAN8TEM6_SOLBU